MGRVNIQMALQAIFCLAMAVMAATLPSNAQVIHEDPGQMTPSNPQNFNDRINTILNNMALGLDNVLDQMYAKNKTGTLQAIDQFDVSCSELKELVWQLNVTGPGQGEVSGDLDSMIAELAEFSNSSEGYDLGLSLYNQSIAGNGTAASEYAGLVRSYYTNLSTSYKSFRTNATALGQALSDNDIDIGSYDDALNSIDNYIYELSDNYSSSGVGGEASTSSGGPITGNGQILPVNPINAWLTIDVDRSNVSCGDQINIFGRMSTVSDIPIIGSVVDISMDNDLAGTALTRDNGSYAYVLQVTPSMAAGIHMINASFTGSQYIMDGPSPGALINITGSPASLTINVPDSATTGGQLIINGTLAISGGSGVDGSNVTVFLDGAPAGSVNTTAGGRYDISLYIPPDASPGNHTVYSSFDPGQDKALDAAISPKAVISFTDGRQYLKLSGSSPISFNGQMILFILLLVTMSAASYLALRRARSRKTRDMVISPDLPTTAITGVAPGSLPEPSQGQDLQGILKDMEAGNIGDVLKGAYISARKAAALHGPVVADSMTHREFFREASKALPEVSGPLYTIVRLYEKAAFSQVNMTNADALNAINSLKDVYRSLRIEVLP